MSLDFENEDEEKKEVELELTMDETVKVIESKEVEELKNELNRIIVPIEAPPMFPKHPVKCTNLQDYPESYNSNTKKEELILQFVENFKSQFQYIYPDRKTLFMCPYNECGVAKFVCSTLRPTTMKFAQLYDWNDCARFVSDYLQFLPLENTTEFPQVLWSPTYILKEQKGNCFDYSMLLASLLIGYGYDAYVVCGYATREVCNMDQSRKICPLLIKAEERAAEAKRKEMGRYTVKPPRDLNSKYIISQEQKARRKLAEAAEKRRIEHEMYLAELEKPPADPLYGQRVHCWVLVLSGKREVPESFFIEALTGTAVSTRDDNYLGIESVWNHKNYWVNMQSCYDGTASLVYDLGDSSRWEYMLPSNDKPHLLIPNLADQNEDDEDDFSSPDPTANAQDLDDEDDDAGVVVDGQKRPAAKKANLIRPPVRVSLKPKKMDPKEVEKHLDLPPSWVKPLIISAKDFERRYPNGIKVVYFKKCKVEKFAPYLLNDKMVLRVTEYKDNEMKNLKQTTEEFMHRADKIKKRVTDYVNGWVVETFDRGRSKCLKEHKYQLIPENERVMLFYDDARVDGLKCREETAYEMVEHFTHRPDFLFYRKVVFEKRLLKRFGPQDGDNFRTILRIIERYNRDESKKAYDDIYEIIYFMEVGNEKFQITYHRESSKIAPSTREFTKPPNWFDKANSSIWKNDLHATYQAGTEYKQKKNVELYQMLLYLYEREENAKSAVRKSEEEVRTILSERTHEETKTEHTISIYDTERNQKAREYKLDLDKKAEEEYLRKQTPKVDYLAPFLAIRGITDAREITTEDAIYLRQMCLADLKQRLIDKANLIQKRFEAENSELQKKQQWYQANQVNMSREDEQEYLDYCAEAMFRIHILELRLNRHKESAPIKYQKMEERLREDPRLRISG